MSNPQTPVSGGRPAKIMSSRLLTMKFMQRAAASSPTTPASSSTQSPSCSSSKRQKLSHSPRTPVTPLSDQQAIQAALDGEEAKRSEALEKIAAERGETKWVLSFVDEQTGERNRGLRVAKAGYDEIDDGDGGADGWGSERKGMLGRMSFGRFNQEVEKQQNGATSGSSFSSDEASEAEEDEDGIDSDDADSADGRDRQTREETVKRVKAERKAKKKAEKAEAARLAESRRSKAVKMNKLQSISGAGRSMAHIVCHRCGQNGHRMQDCPDREGKRKGGYEGDRPMKRSMKAGGLGN